MSRLAVAVGCALALLVAGCGGDDEGRTATAPKTATAAGVPQPPVVRDAPIADGRRIFEATGCLACHQLDRKGNSGPGNNLTGIGARMTSAELRRALVDSPAPMPSFRDLGRNRLDRLVAYLSALRGDGSCPDDADCG